MNESCTFISYHASHQNVFFLLDELHPLFGKLDSLASEVPLYRFQLSFCVFACVSDFNIIGAVWVFEDGALKRSKGVILWLWNKGDKWCVFEIIIIVDDSAIIVVNEKTIIGKKRDCFALLLNQRVIECSLVYLLSYQGCLELCLSVLRHCQIYY